jgi:thiamine biosynthesis lipoprotein
MDVAILSEAQVASFMGRALGSAVRLTVRTPAGRHGHAPAASQAWDEVLDELAAVDLALSRFRDDAEATGLNRLAGTGGNALASWRLRVALAACRRAKAVTGGRFDAGMADVMERIGEHGASLEPRSPQGRVPAAGVPGERGARWPVAVPRHPVDLGGIGKGLALRWAAARAMACLPAGSGLLLDGGGDLVAAGAAPGEGWPVGIEDPVAADPATAEPLAVVALDRGALATSSVSVRRWIAPDGRPVHHLIDPRTREPARTGLIAVTVMAADPAWAEVWTKALFLAGREAIGREARTRGIAAWWVDDAGRLGMTPDARVRSTWLRPVA